MGLSGGLATNGSSGGGGGGSSTLAGDTDVTITSAAQGQTLVYNAATSKWVNPTGLSLVVPAPSGVAATDDANVSALTTKLIAAGGGELVYQAGAYKTTGQSITLGTSRLKIRGQGQATQITNSAAGAGSTANCCFYANGGYPVAGNGPIGSNWLEISDLELVGAATGGPGVWLQGVYQAKLAHLYVHGFTSAGQNGSGIILEESISCIIDNPVVTGCSFAGLYFKGSGSEFVNANIVNMGWISGNTGAVGILFDVFAVGNKIYNTISQSNTTGLKDSGGANAMFGGWIEQNTVGVESAGTDLLLESVVFAQNTPHIQVDATAIRTTVRAPRWNNLPSPAITVAAGALETTVERTGTGATLMTLANVNDSSGGQFTLTPAFAAMKINGFWAPAKLYGLNDVVLEGGAAYVCVTPHTSGAAFTPGNWEPLGGRQLRPSSYNTINSGAAYTVPNPLVSDATTLTLTGNAVFTFPSPIQGQRFRLTLIQDATGTRTVTWPATVQWPAATAPTLTVTAGRTDRFEFVCDDGLTWEGQTLGLNYSGVALFSPGGVAGLTAWFDASQIPGLADGAAVSSWADLSGAANNAVQATGANQPTYYKTTPGRLVNGLPVVYYQDGNRILQTAAFGGGALATSTVFLVLGFSSLVGSPTIFDGIAITNRNAILTGASPFPLQQYAGATLASTTNAPQGVHILTAQYAGVSSLMRLDGTQIVAGSAGTQTLTGASIGGRYSGPGQSLPQSTFCEVLVYSGALSGANITAVETYLRNKWGTA